MENLELFLRQKIYGLYEFTIKTTIALSSSTLAFTIGLITLKHTDPLSHYELLISGWWAIILSIILCIFAATHGVLMYEKSYENIKCTPPKPELDNTEHYEEAAGGYTISAFISFLIGVIFILSFTFTNMP